MTTHTCPHCGQEHPAEARFCPATGKTLDANNTCPRCGATAQNNWRVCPRCGTALSVPARRVPFFVGGTWTWAIILVVGSLVLGITGSIILSSRFRNAPTDSVVSTTTVTPKSNIEPTAPNIESVPLMTITPTQIILASSTETVLATETPASTSTEPQGKVVFACQISRDPNHNQLCLINADGSDWKRLSTDDSADHTYPSLTPDGQAVVFSYKKFGANQIYEMDLSGNLRQLSDLGFDAYAPSVSPDNQRIVFTTNDGNHQTIWIMNRDGQNPYQITDSSEGEAWDPVWSPDGKQILFASNKGGEIQLFMMDGDGSNVRRLTNIDGLRGRSDWSANTQVLSTYKGPSWHREIVTLNLEGNELEQITDGGNNLAPNFSPDGQWIAFTSYKDHYGDDHGCEIYIMQIDGSHVTRLTDNDYCDWQPNWGP